MGKYESGLHLPYPTYPKGLLRLVRAAPVSSLLLLYLSHSHPNTYFPISASAHCRLGLEQPLSRALSRWMSR